MFNKILSAVSAGLLVLAVTVLTVVLDVTAHASYDQSISAQEQPYQPPTENDLPSWAEPFEPLARLPTWAQAALVSVTLTGVAVVVSMLARWIWSLGDESERTGDRSE